MYYDTDYLALIEEIVSVLSANAETEKAKTVAALRDGAATGGELLGAVTHELLALVRVDAKMNQLVGGRVQRLKAICGMYGLDVR